MYARACVRAYARARVYSKARLKFKRYIQQNGVLGHITARRTTSGYGPGCYLHDATSITTTRCTHTLEILKDWRSCFETIGRLENV